MKCVMFYPCVLDTLLQLLHCLLADWLLVHLLCQQLIGPALEALVLEDLPLGSHCRHCETGVWRVTLLVAVLCHELLPRCGLAVAWRVR